MGLCAQTLPTTPSEGLFNMFQNHPLFKSSDAVALNRAVTRAATKIGQGIVDSAITTDFVSLESITAPQRETVSRTHSDLVKVLKDLLQGDGIGIENIDHADASKRPFTDAQLDAGAVALMAAGNPIAYTARAMAVQNVQSMEGVQVYDGSFSSQGAWLTSESKIDMQAFDDRALQPNLGFNVIFNMAAARQDEFGETFYPTLVTTPDQNGVAFSLRKIMFYNEVRHSLSGKPTNFNMLNLLDAFVDASLLSQPLIEAIPYFVTGNAENNANFVDPLVIAPFPVVANGATFDTSALAIGREIDLLGLSQNPGVSPTGTFDSFDSLDHRLALKNLYLRVTNAAATTSVIPVNVSGLNRIQYLKSQEGLDREVVLNFYTVDIPLTGSTLDIAGAAAPALAYLAAPTRNNWIVRLKFAVNGRGNLQFGTVQAVASQVTIESVWRDEGNHTLTQVVDPALIAALKADLVGMDIIGYTLTARRANINRRTMGILVNTQEINEIHTIPLGTPITANNPVTQTQTSTDITAPVTAARVINSNNAVTKIIEYASQLSALKFSYDRKTIVPNVQGIARNIIRPFYEKNTFDAATAINSIKSQDRSLDFSAALIDRIREIVYRMYRESAYQPALDAMLGHTGEKPMVIIGTDPVIARHLIVPGDTRLASIGFESQVVTSMDSRMYGKIFITLTRQGNKAGEPLTFGCMPWMPELAATTQITRNGSTTIETTVQPRSLHINLTPLLIEIDVVNLATAIGNSLPVPMKTIP